MTMKRAALAAMGAFLLFATAGGAASAAQLAPASPQPTDLKPGVAISYYFGDFGHVDEVVDYAGRKKAKVGEPLANVSFRGGGGKPVPGTKFKDLVGAVITGYIRFPEAGSYSFRLRSNDGVRLTISGQTLLEDAKPHPDRDTEAVSVTVGEAGWYPLEVVWFERKGSFVLQLSWSRGGEFTVVPAGQFGH